AHWNEAREGQGVPAVAREPSRVVRVKTVDAGEQAEGVGPDAEPWPRNQSVARAGIATRGRVIQRRTGVRDVANNSWRTRAGRDADGRWDRCVGTASLSGGRGQRVPRPDPAPEPLRVQRPDVRLRDVVVH